MWRSAPTDLPPLPLSSEIHAAELDSYCCSASECLLNSATTAAMSSAWEKLAFALTWQSAE